MEAHEDLLPDLGQPRRAPWRLTNRLVAKELIDFDVPDARLLNESFQDIERVNRWFGGIAPARDAVLALRPASALDIGCGAADLPRAIADSARKLRLSINITCLDANSDILAIAAQRSSKYPQLSFVHGDGDALPFLNSSFDTATCTLALHHCEPKIAIALLREMRRVTPHPIVADLRRCVSGLVGAFLFSRLLSRNSLTRHDAPMSIRRAYTPDEARQLAYDAGWERPLVRKTPFFRMILTNAL